jgi:hypothetical protein
MSSWQRWSKEQYKTDLKLIGASKMSKWVVPYLSKEPADFFPELWLYPVSPLELVLVARRTC